MNERREVRHRTNERSPNYPGIPLGEAIEQARKLYARERRNPVPVDAACAAWGYAPKSSGGLVALAALVRFGLLVSEGSGSGRRVHLSNDAIAIIHDERPGSSEYLKRIREAALRPPLHAELWAQFGQHGGLPSDETLKFELIVQRKFTESGARDFIKQFRATVEFAQLEAEDSFRDSDQKNSSLLENPVPVALEAPLARSEPAAISQVVSQAVTEAQARGVEIRVLQIPIDSPAWPVLQVPYPMTEEAWEQMMQALMVFKRGIVRGPVPKDRGSSE
jgi:hypothetical protein